MKHEEQQSNKRGRERERESKKHDRNGFEAPFSGGFNSSMEGSGFQLSDFPDGDWLYKVSQLMPTQEVM